ncbi:DNA ligase [Vibrio phage Vp_R1]|uniref:DNA ligase n=1 Tax=Vibrio phage Vp_R1 TaxID=2059867 RepID=A0A2H5BPZ6_9CAUD|nr:DNA ligase [Vibrio phage Vp_R1]AUG88385.1 DNA ligase [Vibrio phage Vp_R1]
MNVFEFLGLDPDHRTGNKIVQLVKHLDEVPNSRKHDGLYGAQIKWDGVFGMAVKTGDKLAYFGRTGKMLKNLHKLEEAFPDTRDGVFIGELTCQDMSLEQLSGCIQPNRVAGLSEDEESLFEASLKFNMHDFIHIDDLVEGESSLSYLERYKLLGNIFANEFFDEEPFSVCELKFLDLSQIQEFARKCIEEGHEGVVIKHLDAPWKAGHKGWHSMKIVRGVDYDLLCIGYEEGTGKYTGKVANLLFLWKDGKVVKCMLGKGWTHEDAQLMFEACETGSDLDPCDKIFQVYALQESSKGVLRLPKVGEKRHDKDEPDV